MKVVHLVTFDSGGAFNAAKRISDSLSKSIDSKVLIYRSNDDYVVKYSNFQKIKFWFLRKINYVFLNIIRKDKDYTHEFFSSQIFNEQDIKDADIIHLHWVSSGMLSINDLNKIVNMKKKIVWTLHDMYPMTGGCHYAGKCKSYISDECIRCKKIKFDSKLAYKHLNQMKKVIDKSNIVVVGCSNWISDCARKSYLFKNKSVKTIPNTIDFNEFHRMGFEEDMKSVVFGAYLVNEDKRKGYNYFVEIAKKVLEIDKDIHFYVYGNSENVISIPNVTYLGMINDQSEMVKIYSKAHMFLSLSIEENLSCAIMESLACGTPVIAFDIGGNSDLIFNSSMGKLVKPFNIDDFVNTIIEYTHRSIDHKEIIESTQNMFAQNKVAKMYEKVYLQLLEGKINETVFNEN